MLNSLNLSVVVLLIFFRHTRQLIVLQRFTKKVIVMSGGSHIVQATALFPSFPLGKSRVVGALYMVS